LLTAARRFGCAGSNIVDRTDCPRVGGQFIQQRDHGLLAGMGETELLRTARAIGCRTMDGGMMAVFQAVGAFRLFTGTAQTRRIRRVLSTAY
jgi:hypothetical protein